MRPKDMLAIALLSCAFGIQGHAKLPLMPVTKLDQKIIAHGQKIGWKFTRERGFSQSALPPSDNSAYVKLACGSQQIAILVKPVPSSADLQAIVKHMGQSSPTAPRKRVDEPQLKSTGLALDVLDFSNASAQNAKKFAPYSTRIWGAVGNNVVQITGSPVSDMALSKGTKSKTPKEIYRDEIDLAKFVAQLLKKTSA